MKYIFISLLLTLNVLNASSSEELYQKSKLFLQIKEGKKDFNYSELMDIMYVKGMYTASLEVIQFYQIYDPRNKENYSPVLCLFDVTPYLLAKTLISEVDKNPLLLKEEIGSVLITDILFNKFRCNK